MFLDFWCWCWRICMEQFDCCKCNTPWTSRPPHFETTISLLWVTFKHAAILIPSGLTAFYFHQQFDSYDEANWMFSCSPNNKHKKTLPCSGFEPEPLGSRLTWCNLAYAGARISRSSICISRNAVNRGNIKLSNDIRAKVVKIHTIVLHYSGFEYY